MATIRQYLCRKCPPRHAGKLFDALLAMAQGEAGRCATCGGPRRLRLKFDFGLGARHSDCTVTHVFTPRRTQTWKDAKGRKVQFYPFLVLLDRHGRKRAVWMPYWHLVHGRDRVIKKYGQWAPFMDERLYLDLLAQARAGGLLTPR